MSGQLAQTWTLTTPVWGSGTRIGQRAMAERDYCPAVGYRRGQDHLSRGRQ